MEGDIKAFSNPLVSLRESVIDAKDGGLQFKIELRSLVDGKISSLKDILNNSEKIEPKEINRLQKQIKALEKLGKQVDRTEIDGVKDAEALRDRVFEKLESIGVSDKDRTQAQKINTYVEKLNRSLKVVQGEVRSLAGKVKQFSAGHHVVKISDVAASLGHWQKDKGL